VTVDRPPPGIAEKACCRLLRDYLFGDIPFEQVDRLRAAVRGCTACQELLHIDPGQMQTSEWLRHSMSIRSASWQEVCELCPEIVDRFKYLLARLKEADAPKSCPSTGDQALVAHTVGEPFEEFGRFRRQGLLGRGGFGEVYLAYDPELEREVAIKIVPPRKGVDRQALDRLLQEARAVARLKHAGIVRVFDIMRMPNGWCYIVMEYIQGRSLAEILQDGRPPLGQAVEWARQIALALQHAHAHGIIHRDVKPANVLINEAQRVCVTDFGLAVTEASINPRARERAGTPAYMAPEQVNGETHRLDGRTDLWGLGVTMYEMFVGRRPFDGKTSEDVFQAIVTRDPRPPRQINPELPQALERVCLRCLARPMSQRYLSAADLIEDLEHWQATFQRHESVVPGQLAGDVPHHSGGGSSIESTRLSNVVPKGLRSFDAEDADFYLDLLPGPRDRYGLPDQVRFWKQLLEARDEARQFPVCLLYGPSGCGKSSLVKAGIIPRLTGLRSHFIEATANGTERRLTGLLSNAYPFLSRDWNLADCVSALRQRAEGGSDKIILFVDQLEQWMHGNRLNADLDFVRALRQCDGFYIQAVLLVRDDFWMATSELMRAVEVPISEGKNAAAVGRFSKRHARKVLTAFGRAYGAIGPDSEETPDPQRVFIRHAVDDLAEGDTVSCVHLAIFAEMMKEKEWNLRTLRSVGGSKGVGIVFLEETFSADTAPARYRQMEGPVAGILQALLPDLGVSIRGHAQDQQRLMVAARLPDDPESFHEVVDVLDHELRLISPTMGVDQRQDQEEGATLLYQLTHDFLVSPVREWIRRKQSSTWRGRAALRLEELSRQWKPGQAHRFLPSPPEYVTIVAGVRRRQRSTDARALMKAANWYYGLRAGCTAAVLAVLLLVGLRIQFEQKIELIRNRVSQLLVANPYGMEPTLRMLISDRRYAAPLLQAHLKDADPLQSFRAGLGLIAMKDTSRIDDAAAALAGGLQHAAASECHNVVTALELGPDSIGKLLSHSAATLDPQTAMRLAVVLHHRGDFSLAQKLLQFQPDPKFRTALIHGLDTWHDDIASFLEVLETSTDEASLSGLCKALGRLNPSSLSKPEQKRFVRQLCVLYTTSPFGSVHSAAEWALRNWQQPIPTINPGTSNAGWFVNRMGVTLVLITGNNGGSLPCYMSSKEVSEALFRQFVDQLPEAHPHFTTLQRLHERQVPDGPVAYVTYFEAVRFCNWLSEQDGRQPYYVEFRDQQKPHANETSERLKNLVSEAWNVDERANGYRLPNARQFEAACRARAATMFPFGGEEAQEFAVEYERFIENSWDGKDNSIMPRATRMPNDFGLFDALGNVEEWVTPDPDFPREAIVWGASYFSSRRDTRWNEKRLTLPTAAEPGFRVVCPR
jgi:serine/threonine protein kinase